MLHDLLSDSCVEEKSCDLLVIGGGLAGLLIGVESSKNGCLVYILESGGLHQTEDEHPLNVVDQVGNFYNGAQAGRARCIGGTSTLWGGALLPLTPFDLGCDKHFPGESWGIDFSELEKQLERVEEIFGVAAGAYEPADDCNRYFEGVWNYWGRSPKWPNFKKRNVANIFRNRIRSASNLQVWINATATDFSASHGKIDSVLGRTTNGNTIRIRPRKVVLAAGAIETTRLLLLLDAKFTNGNDARTGALGHYFNDHLSTKIARVEPLNVLKIQKLFGFRFEHWGMRNNRLELTAASRVEKKLPAAFLHVTFETQEASPFDSLRNVFQAIQKHQGPEFLDILTLVRNMPWMTKLALWKQLYKTLLPPPGAEFFLHLVMEQVPSPESQIRLSGKKIDPFGIPMAEIDWRISEQDSANFIRLANLSVSSWRKSRLNKLASLQEFDEAKVREDLLSGGGIFHPAGSTRIGKRAEGSIVDANLKCHRFENLYVLSTSTFQTCGGANPSLTLLLFALRLSDCLAEKSCALP